MFCHCNPLLILNYPFWPHTVHLASIFIGHTKAHPSADHQLSSTIPLIYTTYAVSAGRR